MKSITYFFLFSTILFFQKNTMAQTETLLDETAIHQVLQGMQDAWAAKDGEQFASYFTDDHDFIVWFGLYFPNSNKEQNAGNHNGIFNSVYKNWDIECRMDKIRFIRLDIALVHLLSAGRDKGMDVPTAPSHIQTILMEKTDGKWEIISFHNMNLEYEKILRKPEPTEEEKVAYAKEHYKGWYR